MNETLKNKPGSQFRRLFCIWLIFFVAIGLMVAMADWFQFKDGIRKLPSLASQVLVCTVIASVMWGGWLLVRWLNCWRNIRRALISFAMLATLVAIFYTEEDWRGKHAWENCKRELEAKGVVLDWEKFIPPPVPDDQNFFTVNTNFYLRFVRLQTAAQGEAASQLQWLRLGPPDPVVAAEVTVISSNSDATPGNADLYLRYDHSVLTLGTSREDLSEPQSPFLPIFDIKDVPLKIAIERTAQAAKLNYTIDPKMNSADSKGNPILVTIRWKNVTARQALLALLDNFDLVLVEDSKTGIARILPKKGQIYAESYATKEINRVLSSVLEPDTNEFQGVVLQGATGVSFVGKLSASVKPAHIILRANKIPSVQEMSDIFSKNTAKSTGTNSFSIYGNPRELSAADYLAWSDQYEPAFDEIREALKRPYAMIPGDYSQPFLEPIPNFVTMRTLAQTLAQRTQCYLLLGQPKKALPDLTLMHDLCRILERPPTGKPMTLVEAMINVAISGLYVATVQDGLRLHAWQEPQLAALQKQLTEVNLPPFVSDGFKFEQVGASHTLETTPASELACKYSFDNNNDPKTNFWQKIIYPKYLYYKITPHGWVYQNMTFLVQLEQKPIECFDLVNGIISPRKWDAIQHDFTCFDHISYLTTPYMVLAAPFIPNFIKAWQTTARNQTLVDEAQIVCALERYHLAHGEYPETLDALVPQFIEKLPHDIIGGQPLHYRRTDPPSSDSGAASGKFLLYSVGWNETDDGGQVAFKKGGSEDWEHGDWVWKN